MDVEVVNVEPAANAPPSADASEGREERPSENSSQELPPSQNDNDISEPHLGMEFESENAAKMYYDGYAQRLGFGTCIGPCRSEPDGTTSARDFLCTSKGRSKRKNVETYCNALLKVEKKDEKKWVVVKFVKEHNHPTGGGSPSKVHSIKPRRHFASAKNYPGGATYISRDGYHAPVKANQQVPNALHVQQKHAVRNIEPSNARTPSRKRTLGKDTQNLLDYFTRMQAENIGFFYALQLDNDSNVTTVFWSDARSRTAYSHFGDAVTFDTMYRWNNYQVPLAPFTGVNHHGEMILFGCALLFDESEASFIWLFKTFLLAMSNRRPVSITTDQDRAIQAAVSQVFRFPDTRHRICKWHVLREGRERLAHVCVANPTFQGELYNCISMTETVEEFELSWTSLLAKYNLSNHEWLQALYNARHYWVPVYFRDTFFASVSSNQEGETIRSFFDGYVNQQTTLPMFFRQYRKALQKNWFEKEIEADFNTICTRLEMKTVSPMENQAATIYTKKIFAKFQHELVESFVYTANRIDGDGAISKYRVAKVEDEGRSYMVTLSVPTMKTSCSCLMFEFSGILCRHILTVFTVSNVLTLPSQYILKRWTRNAKSLVSSDVHGGEVQDEESVTKRYNNLCQEAVKYAEEGAIAMETYKMAISALREGASRVAVVKNSVASVPPPSSQIVGDNHEDGSSLWPRQEEVTRRFYINDPGAHTPSSITDLNLPHMAPSSLNRNERLPDNMVILPFLKSLNWTMENKTSDPENRVAVIYLKLLDYGKAPSGISEVKFQLSSSTLEPMLKSMAYISEQLPTSPNRVAVINMKLQDSETTGGESEVKFQVTEDTLRAMLRSMAYIREQLSTVDEPQSETSNKQRQ